MVDSAFSPEVIPLWPDSASGSENWSQQEQETYLPLTVTRCSFFPNSGKPSAPGECLLRLDM